MEEDKSSSTRRKRTSDDNARELWHWKYNYSSKEHSRLAPVAEYNENANNSNATFPLLSDKSKPPTDSVEFKTNILLS